MGIHKLRKSTFWFVLMALIIVMADLSIVRLISAAEEDPTLAYAVLVDCALVVPFLYWLLILRPKGKSIAAIAVLPMIGILAAWLILPPAQRSMAWNGSWPVELFLIAAELAFVGYEARIAYRVIRNFRKVAREERDTAEALRIAIQEGIGMGKLASLVLHEASMMYYLLFSWRRKREEESADKALFSYHKNTNQVLYAAILSKVILIEGVVVHLLLQSWSHWAAWILTIADLWLLALIWGDCRASVLQPVKLADDKLRLRYGLRIRADIPLEEVSHAASAREFQPDPEEQKKAALPIAGTPNVRIELKHPVTVEGLLFLPRKVSVIFLALDEPERFANMVNLGVSRNG
ncbi:hypothetical protein [Cohnella cholangitidis]|uniref:Uncharacterized protein n=1 Tax=Cohnella cholangitidis TaxID=2598458 RepID=A0A7G5BZT7_9BACL|nr:hypothetical protein [Cohnella cholangitidis]QMV42471.1 hypothetical protein FPL14_15650 [Cohnella cholangitidis]